MMQTDVNKEVNKEYETMNEKGETAMENKILNEIKEIMEENEWKYHCEEEEGRLGAGFVNSLLMFEVSEDMVECYTLYYEKVPAEHRAEVLESMTSVNVIGKEGHFEMDQEGHVKFRIRRGVQRGELPSKEDIESMMGRVIHTEYVMISGLFQVARGETEIKSALFGAMMKYMERKLA